MSIIENKWEYCSVFRCKKECLGTDSAEKQIFILKRKWYKKITETNEIKWKNICVYLREKAISELYLIFFGNIPRIGGIGS